MTTELKDLETILTAKLTVVESALGEAKAVVETTMERKTDLESTIIPRIRRTNGRECEIFLGKRTLPSSLVNNETISIILKQLKIEKNCTSVTLSSTSIESPEAQLAILKELCNVRGLINLRLYNIKNIPSALLKELMKLPLRSLTLYHCSMFEKDDGGRGLAKIIAECQSLKSLILVYPGFDSAAYESVTGLPHLERILLEDLQLSEEAFLTIMKSRTLRSLDISIEDPGFSAEVFVKAFQSNTQLESFQCRHNRFATPELQKLLEEALQKNRSQNLSRHKVSFIDHEGRDCYSSENCHSDVSSQVWKALDAKSIDEMRVVLLNCGFQPTGFTEDHGEFERNTFLNVLIANEVHSDKIIRLIDAMKDHINPNEYDFDWKNILIIAAKIYSADNVFKKILQVFGKTLDLNARDTNGCTALHYVCAYGKIDLVQELLKLKSDVTICDFQGRTPFDYAQMSEKELREILSSAYIDADRDARATMNHLLSFLGTLDKTFIELGLELSDFEMSSTLSNFNSIKSATKAEHSSSQNEEHTKKFLEHQDSLRKHFCGKSVMDICMEQRPALLEFLKGELKSAVEDRSLGMLSQYRAVVLCSSADSTESMILDPDVSKASLDLRS